MTARARNLFCGLVVALVVAWSGQAVAQNIYVDYYTPQFYMDHLVFYDEAANPIYYVGDFAYSVPSDTPFFEELVVHYQQNADAYHRWFEEVGYAHLNYRRPVAAHGYTPMYYLDYPVFFDDAGRPIYYVDGVEHPIPRTYARYHLYASHWRARRAHYLRWYRSHGRHYRWWRRPIATGYYRPLYYDGYVVFYDDTGAPYYYMGGRTVYIPRTHRDYHRYHTHWRKHRPHYRRWYRASGRRYHTYRQPKVYRRRAVVTAAPRAVRGRAMHRTYRRRPVVRPRPHPGRPPHARPAHPGRPPHARPGQPGRPPHARPGRGPGHRPGPAAGRIDCRSNPGHPACAGRAGPPKPRGHKGPPAGHRGRGGPHPGGPKPKGPRPGPRRGR